ncbi:uncharacterized protein METZ01_LOCUS269005 [marine metagenome]|uniref:Uncharacterized protein n=1 Tax=marine metagenome TaxID=408172 RepID=A0A382K0F1_9ZZZZ
MFIWDIDKILDSIRNDRFSESDKLKYYIITSLFSLFIAFETFDLLSVSGIIKIILIISLTVIGAIYIYNKNHDGKNFIERTTIFAVPLSFRMILIGGVYGVIAGIVSEIVGCPDCIQSPYFSIITTFIFAIIAIYWEGCWFSRLSENEIKEIETNTD